MKTFKYFQFLVNIKPILQTSIAKKDFQFSNTRQNSFEETNLKNQGNNQREITEYIDGEYKRHISPIEHLKHSVVSESLGRALKLIFM